MSLRRKWKDFLYIKKAIISRDRVKEKNYKIIKEYDHIISIKQIPYLYLFPLYP